MAKITSNRIEEMTMTLLEMRMIWSNYSQMLKAHNYDYCEKKAPEIDSLFNKFEDMLNEFAKLEEQKPKELEIPKFMQ